MANDIATKVRNRMNGETLAILVVLKGYYRLRGDFGPCLQPQPGAATVCIEVLSTFKESFKPPVAPHIGKNGKA